MRKFKHGPIAPPDLEGKEAEVFLKKISTVANGELKHE